MLLGISNCRIKHGKSESSKKGEKMKSDQKAPLKKIGGMDYEPRNEAGVIMLFTLMMKELNFLGVIEAQQGFPDCIARKRGGKDVLVEFEYKSKTFLAHGHDKELKRRKCTIICWEDNYEKPPKNIEIISLARELGVSNRVRLAHAKDKEDIEFLEKTRKKTVPWSMPKNTKKGDLILIWKAGPRQSRFQDIFQALENASPKFGYPGFGKCKIISHLRVPITLNDIRNHRELGRTSLAKPLFYKSLNNELTPYWAWLYQLIVDKNPSLKRSLKTFIPGVFTI
jgi:hypothetical protein